MKEQPVKIEQKTAVLAEDQAEKASFTAEELFESEREALEEAAKRIDEEKDPAKKENMKKNLKMAVFSSLIASGGTAEGDEPPELMKNSPEYIKFLN